MDKEVIESQVKFNWTPDDYNTVRVIIDFNDIANKIAAHEERFGHKPEGIKLVMLSNEGCNRIFGIPIQWEIRDG